MKESIKTLKNKLHVAGKLQTDVQQILAVNKMLQKTGMNIQYAGERIKRYSELLIEFGMQESLNSFFETLESFSNCKYFEDVERETKLKKQLNTKFYNCLDYLNRLPGIINDKIINKEEDLKYFQDNLQSLTPVRKDMFTL